MLIQDQGVLKLFSHLYVKQLLIFFFILPHNLRSGADIQEVLLFISLW